MLTLELEMDPSDWDTIRHDTTNEIEVPATFAATGDAGPILVSVRRKSSRALPSEGDPIKVGMKVDINEFVDQKWRKLTKLSLENGSDTDPVSEGLAWNLHELASTGGYYGGSRHAGLASWVKVYVNGEYVNAEERDKNFRHVDFASELGLKRLYFMWDLDGAITNTNAHIYGRPSKRRFEQSDYERVILNHPDFRREYNAILLGLTAPGDAFTAPGPLSESRLHAFLDAVEPALAVPLAQDPFQPIAAGSHFAGLHDWVSDRVAVVRQPAVANQPAPRPPYAP